MVSNIKDRKAEIWHTLAVKKDKPLLTKGCKFSSILKWNKYVRRMPIIQGDLIHFNCKWHCKIEMTNWTGCETN